MKLLHILSIATLGVLFQVGCSSSDTTTTTDSGTGGDTGHVDTGSGTDTGSSTDTGSGTDTGSMSDGGGMTCGECTMSKCSAEVTKCGGNATCKEAVNCLNACVSSPGDAGSVGDCQNACISTADMKDSMNGIDELITCIQMSCATECTGG